MAAVASYDYFEHQADIGVIGRGATVEQAFVGAARATFAVMTVLDAIQPAQETKIEFEEEDVELALVTWLNLLLARAHERGLVFGEFELRHDGARWSGLARGEPWSERLERGTGVKGATLTALSVEPCGAGWEARCVVDV